ncbi:hypothetical protein [Nonomuraea sp. NPDC049158]|uniref:hypothetical protein n=1 Tax=Nonomuraea sp. NPDC049158 TaxID=3155649 RepID=UPI0033D78C7D
MGSESPTAVDTEPAQSRAAAAAPTVSGRGVAEAFVALADTLVTGSDAADFMGLLTERCVRLLDVDAAGLLVTDQRGELRLMAASSERARSLELSQLRYAQGPCLDCVGGGQAVHCPDTDGAEASLCVGASWSPLDVHAVPQAPS